MLVEHGQNRNTDLKLFSRFLIFFLYVGWHGTNSHTLPGLQNITKFLCTFSEMHRNILGPETITLLSEISNLNLNILYINEIHISVWAS